MTYEEFLDMPTTFMDDMLKVVNIKNKYRLKFTEEETEINHHLLTYWEEMKLLESIVPNFEFTPVLSREEWTGKNGYVHEHYLNVIDNMVGDKPLVYFCGWDRMISEGRQHLAERGFEMMKDIRVEIFG